MTSNWRPWTLEIYAFIQEGLQKSLVPPISKNLTKCLKKCHQNGAKICKMPLWRPPRKHNKNKRKKQRKLDPKSSQRVSHERGFRTIKCIWEGQGARWAPRPPQTTFFADLCASRCDFSSICGACSRRFWE